MDEFPRLPKVSVELKQSAKGAWYVGSLKVNAETVAEMDGLLAQASARLRSRLASLNAGSGQGAASATGAAAGAPPIPASALPRASAVAPGTAPAQASAKLPEMEAPGGRIPVPSPSREAAPVKEAREPKQPKEEIVLTAGEEKLFQNLRELRLVLARHESVPPYVLFHDTALKKLARQKPESVEALRALIGEKRTEKYGDLVLELLERHKAGV